MNTNTLVSTGNDVSLNTYNLNLTSESVKINGNGLLYFYSNANLAMTYYTGARIVLWPGTGTPTSTDWYGLGMNGNTLVYNVPSSCNHLFQVNGTRIAYIDSSGMTIGTSGVRLNILSNSISFTNSGAGIAWGNNYIVKYTMIAI